MIYDEFFDALGILGKSTDSAHSIFHSLFKTLTKDLHQELDVIINSGSPEQLDEFFKKLKGEGDTYRLAPEEKIGALKDTNSLEYEKAQAYRKMSPEQFAALTDESKVITIKAFLNEVRAIKGFRNDIENAFFSGEQVDIPALLERNGVPPLSTNPTDGNVSLLRNADGSPRYGEDVMILVERLEAAEAKKQIALDELKIRLVNEVVKEGEKNDFYNPKLKKQIDDLTTQIEQAKVAAVQAREKLSKATSDATKSLAEDELVKAELIITHGQKEVDDILAFEAEKEWLRQYKDLDDESLVNRDLFMGRISREEANAATAKLREQADAEAAKGKPKAEEAADDEKTRLRKFGDWTVEKAKNRLSWMNEHRGKTAVISVVAPITVFGVAQIASDGEFSPVLEDEETGTKFQSSYSFTIPDDIDDVDDAQEESEKIKEIADNLKESSNAALVEIDNKLLRINDLIAQNLRSGGDKKVEEALTEVRDQVEKIKTFLYADNQPPSFFEYKKSMESLFKEIDTRHLLIMGLADDQAGFKTAKEELPKQLNTVVTAEMYKTTLDQKLSEIESAIAQATLGNPSLTLGAEEIAALDAHKKAVDAEIEKKKKEAEEAKRKADEEARKAAALAAQKAAAAVQNAGAPVVLLADAKTKAKANGDIAQTIINDMDRMVAKGKDDQNKASLYATIQAGLDYATNKQDQAGIDRFTKLKAELDAINEKAEKAATDGRAVLADIRAHATNVDAIQSDALINQANAEIAEQGQKLKDLVKAKDEMKNDYGLVSDAIKANKTVEELKASGVKQSSAIQQQQTILGGSSSGSNSGSSGHSSGSSSGSHGGSQNKPNLPPEIAAAQADVKVMADHNKGPAKPGILSDGTTKVEYGISARLDIVAADIKKTEEQIVRIEQEQQKMRDQGDVAGAVALDNGILRDMRSSLQSMHMNKNAISLLAVEAQNVQKEVNGYTAGADTQKALDARDRFKTLYTQVLDYSKSVQDIKNSNYAKLQGNPVTAKILQDDISNWKKKPGQLFVEVTGGEHGLGSKLVGKDGVPGIAEKYASMGWQGIKGAFNTWKEIGLAQDTEGGRTAWMLANVAGAGVLAAMGINLFNNTAGALAGFKIDGWKSMALIAVALGVALHGTGETGREMELANTVRDNFHSANPLAQNGGGNIPGSSGSFVAVDQKTGHPIQTVSVSIDTKNGHTISTPSGQIGQDADGTKQDVVMGYGGNVATPYNGKQGLGVKPAEEGIPDAHMLPAGGTRGAMAQPVV